MGASARPGAFTTLSHMLTLILHGRRKKKKRRKGGVRTSFDCLSVCSSFFVTPSTVTERQKREKREKKGEGRGGGKSGKLGILFHCSRFKGEGRGGLLSSLYSPSFEKEGEREGSNRHDLTPFYIAQKGEKEGKAILFEFFAFFLIASK